MGFLAISFFGPNFGLDWFYTGLIDTGFQWFHGGYLEVTHLRLSTNLPMTGVAVPPKSVRCVIESDRCVTSWMEPGRQYQHISMIEE